MKRYLIFAGEDYYAYGGWRDFHGSYATVGAAKRGLPKKLGEYVKTEWAQIVDVPIMGVPTTVETDLGL